MKIYTKRGDTGMTDLPGGRRIPKSDIHLEALGTLDELNSSIGVLRSSLPELEKSAAEDLRIIQNTLVSISVWLSGPSLSDAESTTSVLENSIDNLDELLPPLKTFILPGGHPAASAAHMARSICRRAERKVVAFMKTTSDAGTAVAEQPVAYLNRLSDYLFVLARYLNKISGRSNEEIAG